MKTFVLAAALAATLAVPAVSAEPILGKWRAPGGGIVRVSTCGGGYCATVISGEHKGKSVGRMSGTGGEYAGEVTDPRDNRTYSGTARVSATQLKLTGCALKIFCKTQVWTRI
ncbi:DUF2147 domain-containing protein [Jiella sp. MQZ9-1]|uniref:DUF2147 domain-containing protein n=1 Tax=Jiella flava TaxID=2816857 RepID=A0A939JQZ8_9HYPH|nr:DUF2147 domain-containing protein [Jiella flava]MBO0661398.1 DUF2147 domain-containing protein [Jiella flava]MCD2470042.1 DUF2147 domain-containing protein [Jiella flava]